MTKPKREKSSNLQNQLFSTVISVGLVFSGFASPALAVDPTPTASPTVSAPVSPTPAPSSTPNPTLDPTSPPTASPTTPPTSIPRPNIQSAGSLWVVVNKQRPLNPIRYVPKPLANVNGVPLAKDAAAALRLMAADMKKAGAGTLWLNSGYLSFDTQTQVHARQVARLGKVAGERLAARPGYSEHQTGLAADVSAIGQGCAIQVCFSKTKAGRWLAANSWQYGWILRYPDGQTRVTGYQFEPWHFRYVGVELATDYQSKGSKTLEAFWNLPAAPNY